MGWVPSLVSASSSVSLSRLESSSSAASPRLAAPPFKWAAPFPPTPRCEHGLREFSPGLHCAGSSPTKCQPPATEAAMHAYAYLRDAFRVSRPFATAVADETA